MNPLTFPRSKPFSIDPIPSKSTQITSNVETESIHFHITRRGRTRREGRELFDEDINGICNLSPIQRMYGFGGCLVAGFVLMFLSLIVFAKPIKFALLFTFGNVLAVGSTAFIIGPTQQLRMMFDPVRCYATAVYIGFVVLALICALLIHSKILTILAIICEICALVWYSLSYIPFARSAVSNLMIRVFDTEI